MLNLATFNVTITNSFTGDAPADGFIDFKNANHYITFDSTGKVTNIPASLENAEAKARGYYRFKQIINICGFSVNILDLTNMAETGADVNTAPSKVTFTIVYDKPSYLHTPDELNTGSTLSGADCVKRWIARALFNTYTANEEVYDPTPAKDNANVIRGPITEELTIGSLGNIATIESAITVVLDGVDTDRINNAINDTIEY